MNWANGKVGRCANGGGGGGGDPGVAAPPARDIRDRSTQVIQVNTGGKQVNTGDKQVNTSDTGQHR